MVVINRFPKVGNIYKFTKSGNKYFYRMVAFRTPTPHTHFSTPHKLDCPPPSLQPPCPSHTILSLKLSDPCVAIIAQDDSMIQHTPHPVQVFPQISDALPHRRPL